MKGRFFCGLVGACVLCSVPCLHAGDIARQKVTIDGDVEGWGSIPPVIKVAHSPHNSQKAWPLVAGYNDVLKEFYQRLLEKGKPKKLALTAVMRKRLCYLNTLMKRHLQQTQTA